MHTKNRYSQKIKQWAIDYGFSACGIAKATHLHEDEKRLEKWLSKGYHANMDYMANHIELRVDPRLLVPGAKSVLTFLKNYYPQQQQATDVPRIARYAYGKDYHLVIRSQLNEFLQKMKSEFGMIEGRGFVDSAPVLERSWALRSGLGWIGKNGNLISKKVGSYFFIATLIVDIELEYDLPFETDHCGTCRKCIEACPTQAILPNNLIDANRCISYLTIELKEENIPEHFQEKLSNWIFGCDICQEVCPWNRFAIPHQEEMFQASDFILHATKEEWMGLEESQFNRLFKDSALKRSKWKGMRRNLLQG